MPALVDHPRGPAPSCASCLLDRAGGGKFPAAGRGRRAFYTLNDKVLDFIMTADVASGHGRAAPLASLRSARAPPARHGRSLVHPPDHGARRRVRALLGLR